MNDLDARPTDCSTEITPLADTVLLTCRRVAILEARRRGLSHEDAEDVASETVISLLIAVEEGKEIENEGGWPRVAAARIILNRHRNAHRGKRGGGDLSSLDELVEAGFEV
jgi:DNA-directed RNA polymerase specialized sigma24 family protein